MVHIDKIKNKYAAGEGHAVYSVMLQVGLSTPDKLPRDEKQTTNFIGKELVSLRILPISDTSHDGAAGSFRGPRIVEHEDPSTNKGSKKEEE